MDPPSEKELNKTRIIGTYNLHSYNTCCYYLAGTRISKCTAARFFGVEDVIVFVINK